MINFGHSILESLTLTGSNNQGGNLLLNLTRPFRDYKLSFMNDSDNKNSQDASETPGEQGPLRHFRKFLTDLLPTRGSQLTALVVTALVVVGLVIVAYADSAPDSLTPMGKPSTQSDTADKSPRARKLNLPIAQEENLSMNLSRFQGLDRNDDKKLTLDEYAQISERAANGGMTKSQRDFLKGIYKQAYQLLDENNDGIVTQSEFAAYHTRRFQEMDLNEDGVLTVEEVRKEEERLQKQRKDERN